MNSYWILEHLEIAKPQGTKMFRIIDKLHAGNILYAFWAGVLAFFGPLKWWLCACAFFIIVDFITGCWVSRKRGQTWQSQRFRESLNKSYSYMMVIICARMLELILQVSVSRYFTGFICGIEFYSILENFYHATGDRVFYILTQITNKKLKDAVGYDANNLKEENK
ncbi:MAG: phage holin family protein [Alphaproteobacteria bacterium]|nr:phage holin family protein [Alphaproteobacteria bacterium]